MKMNGQIIKDMSEYKIIKQNCKIKMHLRQSSQPLDKHRVFQNKLAAVDSFIKTSEHLPHTLFMHPQLLELHRAQKQYYQIKNILTFKETKTIIFRQFNSALFQFTYTSIPNNKRYCVKISPHKLLVQAEITLDGQSKKKYTIKKEQGIVIKQQNWKQLIIVCKAIKHSTLSLMKIELDVIQVDFKVSTNVVPPQKKIVERELQEYLKMNLNQDKIKQIMKKRRSRSMSRLDNLRNTRYSSTHTNFQTSNSNNKLVSSNSQFFSPIIKMGMKMEQTQQKRDWIAFQNSKQKYFKHFQKMSPQKAQVLKQEEQFYLQIKRQELKSLASLLMSIKFISKICLNGIEISKIKMKEIRVAMLCKKFYRRMQISNKMRLSYRNRNKVSFELNVNYMSAFIFEKEREKAEERITECFKKILFRKDVEVLSEKCEGYTGSTILIQRFLSKKYYLYQDRFTILTQIVKGRIFDSKEQKQACFRNYISAVKKHNVNIKCGFFSHHKQLDAILYQNKFDF